MTAPRPDPNHLARWIGRQSRATDKIALKPAQFMEMTLDRAPRLAEGDALPALWHWLYFLDTAPLSGLGRDGHPAPGGFLPPVALPRRMWAGGRLGFLADLPIGVEAGKVSTVTDVQLKQGRSGPLCFVTVRHEIAAEGTPRLWEEHDIVYREDPRPDAPRPGPGPAPADWPVRETVAPDPVLLFRYSALTFNGHRIHYDRDYATGVEGHDGLVVHGPLIATLLADLARRVAGGRRLSGFSFRARAPLFDAAPFAILARPDGPDRIALAAATPAGGLAMQAEARFAPA